MWVLAPDWDVLLCPLSLAHGCHFYLFPVPIAGYPKPAIGFLLEKKVGVVILSNTASSIDPQARELLTKLAEIAVP